MKKRKIDTYLSMMVVGDKMKWKSLPEQM